MKQKELNEILRLHEMWLNDKEGGKRADFQQNNLQDANLRGALLGLANLQYADLRNANLQDANLRGALLGLADLQYADLRNADLRHADLCDANLRHADLRHADLLDTDLRNANLQYADLRNANLKDADLQGVVWDFSCFPLWCGGAYFKTDVKLLRQLAAHMCTLECDDDEWLALKEAILPFAKKSHRAEDLGLLDREKL